MKYIAIYLRLIRESFVFAWSSLKENKLRTFLSLLGITIGIFTIISVLTMVDSLEKNIRNSIESLGDDVVFVQKWPWAFGGDYPWWKYWKRPEVHPNELRLVKKEMTLAAAACFQASTVKTITSGNNAIEGVQVLGVSQDYDQIKTFDFKYGRYFSISESNSGKPVCLLGDAVALGLFGPINPVGRSISIEGRKLEVIGLLKREGESVLGNSVDKQVIMPINFLKRFVDLDRGRGNPMIMVKARDGISNEALKNELTGIMRSVRKLKPTAEDDFALNETSMLSQGFEPLFDVIAKVGWFISIFSLFVGGFSIANIMFVSVKERTNQIGIQKAVGAKSIFILLQFLFEATFLSIFGGVIGLIVVYLLSLLADAFVDMDIFLSWNNIFLGAGMSTAIGLLAGIIPASTAAKLTPVDAMRKN